MMVKSAAPPMTIRLLLHQRLTDLDIWFMLERLGIVPASGHQTRITQLLGLLYGYDCLPPDECQEEEPPCEHCY